MHKAANVSATLAAAILGWFGCGGGKEYGTLPQSPSGSDHPGAADSAPAVASPHPEEGGELHWTMPPGWKEETPSSSMRRAQYALPRVPGDPRDGECAVFYFGPGQGGDARANVERWASQFSDDSGGSPSPAVAESTVAGLKVTKISVGGTYHPSRMMGGAAEPQPGSLLLGAIVEGPDSNWFFKCTGPQKTMESHRQAFDQMVDSVHVGP